MRLPRMTTRRWMIAVAAAAIATRAYSCCAWESADYTAGWWEAEHELRRGEATVYKLGGLPLGDICDIDEDTGLPIRRVSGCMVSARDIQRVSGHNDRIERYIRSHGIPGNTLKPWQGELFHLKRYFDDRLRIGGTHKLHAGGPAVVSPDGRSNVKLIARFAVADDGSPIDSLKVVISTRDAVLDDWRPLCQRGDFDFIWEPEGSRFVVLRSISAKEEHFEAYDLRTGHRLCTETWYDKRRLTWSNDQIPVPNRKRQSRVHYTDLDMPLLR